MNNPFAAIIAMQLEMVHAWLSLCHKTLLSLGPLAKAVVPMPPASAPVRAKATLPRIQLKRTGCIGPADLRS